MKITRKHTLNTDFAAVIPIGSSLSPSFFSINVQTAHEAVDIIAAIIPNVVCIVFFLYSLFLYT